MADWLHCNTCYRQPGDGGTYYLTCCGHVYCEQCGNKGWKEKCLLCGTGTPAAFRLTSNLPSSIAAYFKNPVPLLKKAVAEINEVMSAIEFQNSQRIRFATRLQATIKQQREVVQKLNNDIRDKMTVMLKQTERERATLKEQLKYVIEENKYMKQILSEQTSPKRRSPFGDRYRPDSSNSPVIKSSAGNTPGFPFGMNRTSSTDLQKNTPALPNNAVTSGRISVRTPPSGGKMGTIPTNATSTPPCHQQHYKTPKSVPHPINFGDWNMEESPH